MRLCNLLFLSIFIFIFLMSCFVFVVIFYHGTVGPFLDIMSTLTNILILFADKFPDGPVRRPVNGGHPAGAPEGCSALRSPRHLPRVGPLHRVLLLRQVSWPFSI